MALYENGGRSLGESTGSARTRPIARETRVRSEPSSFARASRRVRASSKVSTSGCRPVSRLALEQRDGVVEGRNHERRHGERDRAGASGQRRHESAAKNPGNGARKDRARAHLLKRKAPKDLAEAVEVLFE